MQVGPLAFDALHAMILDRVQTDDPVATLSSSKQCAGDAQGGLHCVGQTRTDRV